MLVSLTKTKLTTLSMIRYAFLLICCMGVFGGCDKDDAKPAQSHIIILGKKYKIKHVLLKHGGKSDPAYKDTSPDPTHYQYTLYISDGTVSIAGGPSAIDATYLINISFFTTLADHTAEFTGGNFDPLDPQDYFGGNCPLDKSFFTVFFIRIDTNGNSVFDINENDKFYDATAGQITISGGINDEYVIIFKNELTDGPASPVTGKIGGRIQVIR